MMIVGMRNFLTLDEILCDNSIYSHRALIPPEDFPTKALEPRMFKRDQVGRPLNLVSWFSSWCTIQRTSLTDDFMAG